MCFYKIAIAYFIVLNTSFFSPLALGQPPNGWKMTDRFTGFRFEMIGKVQNVGMLFAIQKKADTLGCFGWVQNSFLQTKSIVGEARCNKVAADIMKQWLNTADGHPEESLVENIEIKDYEDSKIKLHFSHFKILDDERETCFFDRPHQCPEFN